MKKTMLKRLRAALVAAAMGATLAGCTEKEIRDEYNKEKESILNEIDEKLNKQNEDLKNYIDGKKVTETTNTTTETTYTQTLSETEETITTESNTTELTYYTSTSKEQTTEETKETMPSLYVENRYMLNQYGSEYTVTKENGEYLYSIARKFDKENTNETLKNIKELNRIDENDNFISTNRTILLPFNVLYYIAKPGEDLFDISLETGVSLDELGEKNNITNVNEQLGNNKKIILTMLKKGETSFQTENGMANMYQGNVIYADKLIGSTGYSGASNHVLTLNPSETGNYVEYLKFDGYGNYTTTLVAINVEDIKAEDGYLIIVKNDNTEVYGSGNKLIKIEKSNVKTLK